MERMRKYLITPKILERQNGALPEGRERDGRERRLRVDGVASSQKECFSDGMIAIPKGVNFLLLQ
jgi:hypothetical protein